MIKIDIDNNQINNILNEFKLEIVKIEKAKRWALSSTARWAKSQCATRIAKETGLQRTIIFNRLKDYGYTDYFKVFYGLYRVSLSRLTPNNKDRAGVRYGTRKMKMREKAFMPFSNSSKAKSPDQAKLVVKRTSKDRLSWQKQFEPIDAVASKIISQFAQKELSPKFLEELKKALQRVSK